MAQLTVHRAPWVLPMDGAPLRDGEVAVSGGLVVAVGRDLAGAPVDHEGVLLPGLVNAHAHLQYGPAFADLAVSGLPFAQWLITLSARRRATDDTSWLAQARASAGCLLATGTTTVADVVSNAAAVPGRGALAGISYIEAVAADQARWDAELRAVFEAAVNAATGAGISPHSPYSLSTSVFRALIAAARERGLRLHPHVAESLAEVTYVALGTGPPADLWREAGLDMELMRSPSGLTPVGYVESLGGLGPDVHIAHGVHVGAADRALLRHHGTSVALCPRSNAILAAGEAPVASYRAEGNLVAVGTDSLASTPDLDLLAELRSLRELALRQRTPSAGLDEWLVRAATTGGATAMGLAGVVGVLAPGARADLAIVAGEHAADPYALVVNGRASATYLAGELVSA